MAAMDTFETFVNQLSTQDKEKIKAFLTQTKEQVFAARSEDARVRIVHEFIREINDMFQPK